MVVPSSQRRYRNEYGHAQTQETSSDRLQQQHPKSKTTGTANIPSQIPGYFGNHHQITTSIDNKDDNLTKGTMVAAMSPHGSAYVEPRTPTDGAWMAFLHTEPAEYQRGGNGGGSKNYGAIEEANSNLQLLLQPSDNNQGYRQQGGVAANIQSNYPRHTRQNIVETPIPFAVAEMKHDLLKYKGQPHEDAGQLNNVKQSSAAAIAKESTSSSKSNTSRKRYTKKIYGSDGINNESAHSSNTMSIPSHHTNPYVNVGTSSAFNPILTPPSHGVSRRHQQEQQQQQQQPQPNVESPISFGESSHSDDTSNNERPAPRTKLVKSQQQLKHNQKKREAENDTSTTNTTTSFFSAVRQVFATTTTTTQNGTVNGKEEAAGTGIGPNMSLPTTSSTGNPDGSSGASNSLTGETMFGQGLWSLFVPAYIPDIEKDDDDNIVPATPPSVSLTQSRSSMKRRQSSSIKMTKSRTGPATSTSSSVLKQRSAVATSISPRRISSTAATQLHLRSRVDGNSRARSAPRIHRSTNDDIAKIPASLPRPRSSRSQPRGQKIDDESIIRRRFETDDENKYSNTLTGSIHDQPTNIATMKSYEKYQYYQQQKQFHLQKQLLSQQQQKPRSDGADIVKSAIRGVGDASEEWDGIPQRQQGKSLLHQTDDDVDAAFEISMSTERRRQRRRSGSRHNTSSRTRYGSSGRLRDDNCKSNNTPMHSRHGSVKRSSSRRSRLGLDHPASAADDIRLAKSGIERNSIHHNDDSTTDFTINEVESLLSLLQCGTDTTAMMYHSDKKSSGIMESWYKSIDQHFEKQVYKLDDENICNVFQNSSHHRVESPQDDDPNTYTHEKYTEDSTHSPIRSRNRDRDRSNMNDGDCNYSQGSFEDDDSGIMDDSRRYRSRRSKSRGSQHRRTRNSSRGPIYIDSDKVDDDIDARLRDQTNGYKQEQQRKNDAHDRVEGIRVQDGTRRTNDCFDLNESTMDGQLKSSNIDNGSRVKKKEVRTFNNKQQLQHNYNTINDDAISSHRQAPPIEGSENLRKKRMSRWFGFANRLGGTGNAGSVQSNVQYIGSIVKPKSNFDKQVAPGEENPLSMNGYHTDDQIRKRDAHAVPILAIETERGNNNYANDTRVDHSSIIARDSTLTESDESLKGFYHPSKNHKILPNKRNVLGVGGGFSEQDYRLLAGQIQQNPQLQDYMSVATGDSFSKTCIPPALMSKLSKLKSKIGSKSSFSTAGTPTIDSRDYTPAKNSEQNSHSHNTNYFNTDLPIQLQQQGDGAGKLDDINSGQMSIPSMGIVSNGTNYTMEQVSRVNTYDYESTSHAYVAYYRRGAKGSVSIRQYENPRPPEFPLKASADSSSAMVVVQVDASTISATDCAVRRGDYWNENSKTPLQLPIVPGVAFVGRVLQTSAVVGGGADMFGLKEGDQVLSLVQSGANSRHLCVPSDRLVKIMDDTKVDSCKVACLPEIYLTAFQALHIGQQNAARYRRTSLSGKYVLILGGATTIGRALIEISLAAGCEAIYATGKDSQFDAIKAMGALPIGRDPKEWSNVLYNRIDILVAIHPSYFPSVEKSDLTPELAKTVANFGKAVVLCAPEIGNGSAMNLDDQTGLSDRKGSGRQLYFYNVFDLWDTDLKQGKRDLTHLVRLLADNAIRPKVLERVALNRVAKAQDLLDMKKLNGFIVCEPWAKCLSMSTGPNSKTSSS